MTNALSISKPGTPARAPGSALKKAPKKGAKKAAAKHPPKKHAGPGHEHQGKHDDQADVRRAYLHLSRASTLMQLFPQCGALSELKNLYALCQKLAETDRGFAKAAAESARALEHLCFVSLAAEGSGLNQTVSKASQHDFRLHFEHDLEKQRGHLEEAEEAAERLEVKGHSPAAVLLDLARHSLATAEQMLQRENWHLAHECLRAADAITKAIEHW